MFSQVSGNLLKGGGVGAVRLSLIPGPFGDGGRVYPGRGRVYTVCVLALSNVRVPTFISDVFRFFFGRRWLFFLFFEHQYPCFTTQRTILQTLSPNMAY